MVKLNKPFLISFSLFSGLLTPWTSPAVNGLSKSSVCIAPLERASNDETTITIKWPSDSSPSGGTHLVQGLRKAFSDRFIFQRKPIDQDIPWTGPSRPNNHNSFEFAKQLTKEELERSDNENNRDPLNIALGILTQIGMEQGRRALLAGPHFTDLEAAILSAEQKLASGDRVGAQDDLSFAIKAFKDFDTVKYIRDLNLGDLESKVKANKSGGIDWPNSGKLLPMDALTSRGEDLLRNLYTVQGSDGEIHSKELQDYVGAVLKVGMEQGVRWENQLNQVQFRIKLDLLNVIIKSAPTSNVTKMLIKEIKSNLHKTR